MKISYDNDSLFECDSCHYVIDVDYEGMVSDGKSHFCKECFEKNFGMKLYTNFKQAWEGEN